MNKSKKIFQLATRGFGILLVVLLIFVLVSPMLINLEPVKDKILAYVSEKTKGELLYNKVDILYFPRPHAVIHYIFHVPMLSSTRQPWLFLETLRENWPG